MILASAGCGLPLWPGWVAAQNLIENGGFELWSPLSESALREVMQRDLAMIPENQMATGWVPVRERVKDGGRTATMAMDGEVRHSGQRSLRIVNGDMRDITYARVAIQVRPNRRYLVRWWVKGENVWPDGTGPILMMHVLSGTNGKSVRTNSSESGGAPLPKGSFDWQNRQFVFITEDAATVATLTFQLRWATGTVWYDDIEVLDKGPVVQVRTF